MIIMRPNEVFAFIIMLWERIPRYETRFITFGKIINMLGTYYSFILYDIQHVVAENLKVLAWSVRVDSLVPVCVCIIRWTTVSAKRPCLDCWVSFT
jgi:hypothetical protein